MKNAYTGRAGIAMTSTHQADRLREIRAAAKPAATLPSTKRTSIHASVLLKLPRSIEKVGADKAIMVPQNRSAHRLDHTISGIAVTTGPD